MAGYVWETAWSAPFVALTTLGSLRVIVGARDILGAARTIHSIPPGHLTDLTIEYRWDHRPRRHGLMSWATCCFLQRVKRNLRRHLEHATFIRLQIVFGLHPDVTDDGKVFRQWMDIRLQELQAIFFHAKTTVTLQPGVHRHFYPDNEAYQRSWEREKTDLDLLLRRRGRKHGVSVFRAARQFTNEQADDTL